jgi:hypothetical protein
LRNSCLGLESERRCGVGFVLSTGKETGMGGVLSWGLWHLRRC